MLVLSRKNNQAVVIGGPDDSRYFLKITVLKISGRSVQLGFEASKDLPVHREEVWERISTSHSRDPSTGSLDRTGSQDAKEMASVLSEE